MATQIQWRRGNTAQTSVFTGVLAEITVDTDKKTLIVHDGATVGGIPLAKESYTQSAFDKANTTNILTQGAFDKANNEAGVNLTQNTNITSATTIATGAFDKANSANVLAQDAYNQANTGTTLAQGAFNKANSANVLAQASYDSSNTKFSSSGGTISGDVTVSGNLTVVGQQVYANTETVLIKDNIVTLNAAINQASAPSVDAGLEVDRGSSSNVFLIWNETADKWQFTNDGTNYFSIADEGRLNSVFDLANGTAGVANTDGTNISAIAGVYGNSTFVPSVTLTANGRVSAITNTAIAFPVTSVVGVTGAISNTDVLNGIISVDGAGSNLDADLLDGLQGASYANSNFSQASFDKANGAVQSGFVTIAANSINVVADSNNDTLTLTSANGVGIYAVASSDTITINLTPTGITSGIYGGSANNVLLTIDQYGRVTAASNIASSGGGSSGGTTDFAFYMGAMALSNG